MATTEDLMNEILLRPIVRVKKRLQDVDQQSVASTDSDDSSFWEQLCGVADGQVGVISFSFEGGRWTGRCQLLQFWGWQ